MFEESMFSISTFVSANAENFYHGKCLWARKYNEVDPSFPDLNQLKRREWRQIFKHNSLNPVLYIKSSIHSLKMNKKVSRI